MPELETSYLGLELKNPLVAGASPLSKNTDMVCRLEDAGAAAVVMHSLFEEQIEHDSRALDYFLNRGTESFAEAMTYFPDLGNYNIGPDDYLALIQRLKSKVEIPIIASLNGIGPGGWVETARKIEQAGADALELNVYFLAADLDTSSAELEESYIDLVSDVCSQVHIPVAVKLSPYFTALPNLTQSLVRAGANGLVLFNRFMQPDLDIETLIVEPRAEPSTSSALRLPLRWVSILSGRVEADLSLSGGVHTAVDVVKALMAGADSVQMVSALLAHGPNHLNETLGALMSWMDTYEYASVKNMQGSLSQKNVKDPSAYERAQYMRMLTSMDGRLPD
jgi:dihydroorotate dehydrogenase (fumarate)